MQVLDLLVKSGISKANPLFATVFQITRVSDAAFPYMQHFFLPTPKESSALVLTCLAARLFTTDIGAWQDYCFPRESASLLKALPDRYTPMSIRAADDLVLLLQQRAASGESHGHAIKLLSFPDSCAVPCRVCLGAVTTKIQSPLHIHSFQFYTHCQKLRVHQVFTRCQHCQQDIQRNVCQMDGGAEEWRLSWCTLR